MAKKGPKMFTAEDVITNIYPLAKELAEHFIRISQECIQECLEEDLSKDDIVDGVKELGETYADEWIGDLQNAIGDAIHDAKVKVARDGSLTIKMSK